MNKVSTGTIVALALVCIIGFTVVTMVGSYFTYNNQEIDLRQQCEAQRGKVEGVHDAMWKIISQKAQVSQEYRAGFDSIYTHIIEGRYSQGDGSLMKWIQEANPQFDTSLYKDVMDAIEQQRTIFRKAQESKRLFGNEYTVAADIYSLDAFSGHGDYKELVDYLKCQEPSKIKQTFLVHGDPDALQYYKRVLRKEGWENVVIPEPGESFELK